MGSADDNEHATADKRRWVEPPDLVGVGLPAVCIAGRFSRTDAGSPHLGHLPGFVGIGLRRDFAGPNGPRPRKGDMAIEDQPLSPDSLRGWDYGLARGARPATLVRVGPRPRTIHTPTLTYPHTVSSPET